MCKKRKIGLVDYTKIIVPEDYSCDLCGVHGVKLWREIATPVVSTRLLCARCAETDQQKKYEQGWKSSFLLGGNSIGIFTPAIPIEGQDSFWGNTSTPDHGFAWWKKLPA